VSAYKEFSLSLDTRGTPCQTSVVSACGSLWDRCSCLAVCSAVASEPRQ